LPQIKLQQQQNDGIAMYGDCNQFSGGGGDGGGARPGASTIFRVQSLAVISIVVFIAAC
jgi:hypothetical protein